MRTLLTGAVVTAVLVVEVSELASWRAARTPPGIGRPRGAAHGAAIVVLGFPGRRNGALHPVQRWRTEIAVRTLDAAPGGRLVFTGGATRPGIPAKAEMMATYAQASGVPPELITVETASRTTWQNLLCAVPLIGDGEQVIVASSDPLHAARSRRYLVQQRPELAKRLHLAEDHRLLERWWLKPPVLVHELRVRLRDAVTSRSRAALDQRAAARRASRSGADGSASWASPSARSSNRKR